VVLQPLLLVLQGVLLLELQLLATAASARTKT
jgi:hypothetical protein